MADESREREKVEVPIPKKKEEMKTPREWAAKHGHLGIGGAFNRAGISYMEPIGEAEYLKIMEKYFKVVDN